MTPAETLLAEALLAEAREAGVNLYIYRGELIFETPPGSLTPDLLVRLRAAKQELHALLSTAAACSEVAEKLRPTPVVQKPTRLPENCPQCNKRTRWLPLAYPGRFLCKVCWSGFGSDYPPGGPPPDPALTAPCYCTSTRFWRSPAGVVRCAACSPPAQPLQATWLEVNKHRRNQ